MHYHDFWSKLYFHMKFLQDIYFWHALFVCLFVCLFFYHSVALAAWSGIQRVDQQMIASILSFFITWCAGASSIPKQYLFSLDSWKKTYFGHSSKKDNHPRPLPQQCFCTSFQIWGELGVTWQTKQRVFLPSRRPLNLNILNTFSWPFLDCYVRASSSSLLFCI